MSRRPDSRRDRGRGFARCGPALRLLLALALAAPLAACTELAGLTEPIDGYADIEIEGHWDRAERGGLTEAAWILAQPEHLIAAGTFTSRGELRAAARVRCDGGPIWLEVFGRYPGNAWLCHGTASVRCLSGVRTVDSFSLGGACMPHDPLTHGPPTPDETGR